MIERIYFILFTCLVMLFGASSQPLQSSPLATGASIYTLPNHKIAVNLPFQVNIEKDKKLPVNSKIRIKAWDDAAYATIVSYPILLPKVFYSAKEEIFGYTNFHLSTAYLKSYLRGPPALVS